MALCPTFANLNPSDPQLHCHVFLFEAFLGLVVYAKDQSADYSEAQGTHFGDGSLSFGI